MTTNEKQLVSMSLTTYMLPHSCSDCPVRKACEYLNDGKDHDLMDCADVLFSRLEKYVKKGDL